MKIMLSASFSYMRYLLKAYPNIMFYWCPSKTSRWLRSPFKYFTPKEINPCLKYKQTNVFKKRIHSLKKLKNNGFNPNQKIVTINQTVYIVHNENVAIKSKARQTRNNLINHGFKNSFINTFLKSAVLATLHLKKICL